MSEVSSDTAVSPPLPPNYDTPDSDEQDRSRGIGIWQYIILVGVGAFSTTFAQQKVLALFPTTFLLKDHLHFKREDVSFFMFIATFAWNVKPFAGILTDAFPLLGTRRKSYMVIGSGVAALLWALMAKFPSAYTPLLLASIGMNIATVFASTVMGGLMVEAGQIFGASGSVSSLRQFVQSIAQIAAPLIGGAFAAKMTADHGFHGEWWTYTMMIAAGAMFALTIVAILVLKEKRAVAPPPVHSRPSIAVPPGVLAGIIAGTLLGTSLMFELGKLPHFVLNQELWKLGVSVYALVSMFILIIALIKVPTYNPVVVKAQVQLGQILKSRTLWMAVVMLFLVYIVPGFNTALTYRQEDVMKFSKNFIGMLGSVEGGAGVAAALVYLAFCRLINLRILIVLGVGLNALCTLLYWNYHPGVSHSVIIGTHAAVGFWVVISELCLMDLAVRSTPRGCEALGFALMMSVRNFGIAVSDLLGSKILDAHLIQNVVGKGADEFNWMVGINSLTTIAILLFVPFLPRIIMSKKEGEHIQPPYNTAAEADV